jgi:hypothetical protein
MVLPSLVLLASFATVGFAAPSPMDGVDSVIAAIDKITECAKTVGTDLTNFPASMSVSFYFSYFSVFLFSLILFFFPLETGPGL